MGSGTQGSLGGGYGLIQFRNMHADYYHADC